MDKFLFTWKREKPHLTLSRLDNFNPDLLFVIMCNESQEDFWHMELPVDFFSKQGITTDKNKTGTSTICLTLPLNYCVTEKYPSLLRIKNASH